MRLHQRGIDLLVNIQDLQQHAERLTEQDVRRILEEAEEVLRLLLARDAPAKGKLTNPSEV